MQNSFYLLITDTAQKVLKNEGPARPPAPAPAKDPEPSDERAMEIFAPSAPHCRILESYV